MNITIEHPPGNHEGQTVLFRNVRVVLPDRVTSTCDIDVRQGRIDRIGPSLNMLPGATVVESHGLYAAPGFVDIHCHSDGVTSFFDDVNRVAANLLADGTTGVLATLSYVEMQPGRLHHQVESLWNARTGVARQVVLGVHLEGPYINPKHGALVRQGSVHPPDPTEYRLVLTHWSEVVRLWTIAPEMPGAEPFIQTAAEHGVILAAGHTEADAKLLAPFVNHGLRLATHWSNATGAPHPRFKGTVNPGINEFALVEDSVLAEVICDSAGLHVSPLMLRLLYKAKGADGIILISDAYWDTSGKPRHPDDSDVYFTVDGELCGSRLTMLQAARNVRTQVGCGLPEIFRMGALNPARLFGWDTEMGSLEPGKKASILLLDDNLNLHGVWLAGRRVGKRPIDAAHLKSSC